MCQIAIKWIDKPGIGTWQMRGVYSNKNAGRGLKK
jgi:hypothetical protein